ncbi:DUF3795 domain-containing protein [Clostridia bacterium OttesenSCG-928-F22]|nr:DUF3795 domain-containing protein [Clostridia bacterium OttesenSCG-928-F22]
MQREYPRLSACGLNCGLCPRYHTQGGSRCPGCGGEGFYEKRPSCGILSCCKRHGEIESCYLCEEYPCKKYDGVEQVDSFITHRNMLDNFAEIKQDGLAGYRQQLDEKVRILRHLLEQYNDGRKKSFFCTAVNLLELDDVKQVMEQLSLETQANATSKEKAAFAVELFEKMAEERGVSLVLRKKGKY